MCVEAFKQITGISSGALQNARELAQRNVKTVVSLRELGLWMQIRNAPRAHKYLETWTILDLSIRGFRK